MNYLKKLSPFSFLEKLSILKYSIGNFLVDHTPDELKRGYLFTNELLQKGIKIKKDGSKFKFVYPINNLVLNFELDANSSDPAVFRQVIIQEEYKDIINIIKANNSSCSLMIDAGANIGHTSIYFKAHFPNLNIIALEPSNDTGTRFERNVEINGLKNIKLLKKGLWSCSTRLKGDRSFRDGRDWSFRLVEAMSSEDALFETISIADLIEEFEIRYIDFLKIDVEGAEEDIFKNNVELSWLNKVRLIAIEIHDEFDCRSTIEQILIANHFELSFSGELTIGINRSLVSS